MVNNPQKITPAVISQHKIAQTKANKTKTFWLTKIIQFVGRLIANPLVFPPATKIGKLFGMRPKKSDLDEIRKEMFNIENCSLIEKRELERKSGGTIDSMTFLTSKPHKSGKTPTIIYAGGQIEHYETSDKIEMIQELVNTGHNVKIFNYAGYGESKAPSIISPDRAIEDIATVANDAIEKDGAPKENIFLRLMSISSGPGAECARRLGGMHLIMVDGYADLADVSETMTKKILPSNIFWPVRKTVGCFTNKIYGLKPETSISQL